MSLRKINRPGLLFLDIDLYPVYMIRFLLVFVIYITIVFMNDSQ